MDQSYTGRWIVRLDGYHMIIEHRMRDKHHNADNLAKRPSSMKDWNRSKPIRQKSRKGSCFWTKKLMNCIPFTRWLVNSGYPIRGHPELPEELSKKDTVPLDLLLRSNMVQQELPRMNINSLSLLDRTVEVTPQVMRMLGGLLEREVARDDPELAAAMASLTVSEKVKIMPSRRQHKENERDCRKIVQQLVSSIPQEVLTSISFKRKEQRNDTHKKTVTFEDQLREGEEMDISLE